MWITNCTHGKKHLVDTGQTSLISRCTCTYVLVTEKNRPICKAHLRYTCDFITEFKGHTDPAMKIDMHIFSACMQYGQTHPFLKGNLQETCTRAFPLQVLQDLPIDLQGLHMPYNTLTCPLHVYKPTVQPVASSSLFFDLQVVTLLLAEYTLFARANLCYPTTRLCSYFSTIFAAHLRVYTRTMGCKRDFKVGVLHSVQKGHIGINPQLCHTWESNPHKGDRCQTCKPLGH